VNATRVTIAVDGHRLEVEPGTTVAAALLNHGITAFRDSVKATPRGPVCGLGSCFECRVTVNGVAEVRACLVACAPDMVIETGGAR
jgi:predicted molibdopterin-dependent oxidoreductase YjgC